MGSFQMSAHYPGYEPALNGKRLVNCDNGQLKAKVPGQLSDFSNVLTKKRLGHCKPGLA